MRFVWGLVWVAIGVLLIRYAFVIVRVFGRIGWAEAHLSGGFGGTYTFYKLAGLIIIVLAMLYMFDAMDFILSPLGTVFTAPPQ